MGMLIKLESKTAEHVSQRLSENVGRLPSQLTRSLTWDQGSEMAAHATFKVATGVPVYFCGDRQLACRFVEGLLRRYHRKLGGT